LYIGYSPPGERVEAYGPILRKNADDMAAVFAPIGTNKRIMRLENDMYLSLFERAELDLAVGAVDRG